MEGGGVELLCDEEGGATPRGGGGGGGGVVHPFLPEVVEPVEDWSEYCLTRTFGSEPLQQASRAGLTRLRAE